MVALAEGLSTGELDGVTIWPSAAGNKLDGRFMASVRTKKTQGWSIGFDDDPWAALGKALDPEPRPAKRAKDYSDLI